MSKDSRPVNPEWTAFHQRDYMELQRHMSLEQRGLYCSIYCAIFDGNIVPEDRRLASRMLGVQTLKYAKILSQLLALGAVVEANSRIEIPRAVRSRADTVASILRRRGASGGSDAGHNVIAFPPADRTTP